MPEPSNQRTCNTCGQSKPLESYHKNSRGRGGRLAKCSECRKLPVPAEALRGKRIPGHRVCCLCKGQTPVALYHEATSRCSGCHGLLSEERRIRALRAYDPAFKARHELDKSYRRTFNLSLEDYESLLSLQGGGCKTCGTAPGEKRLAVDHCHRTGVIRGLLCHHCNMILGLCEDDALRLRSLAEYVSSSTNEYSVTPAQLRRLEDKRRYAKAYRTQV